MPYLSSCKNIVMRVDDLSARHQLLEEQEVDGGSLCADAVPERLLPDGHPPVPARQRGELAGHPQRRHRRAHRVLEDHSRRHREGTAIHTHTLSLFFPLTQYTTTYRHTHTDTQFYSSCIDRSIGAAVFHASTSRTASRTRRRRKSTTNTP